MKRRSVLLIFFSLLMSACLLLCGCGCFSSSAPVSGVYPSLPSETASKQSQVSEKSSSKVSSQTSSALPTTVSVTIPEGYSMIQIFKLLEENHVSSFDKLLKTAQSYDYSYYPLIDAAGGENRCYSLEGYLFPDTYEFYTGEKPQNAIGRFLRNSEAKFTEQMRKRAKELGLTEDEVIIIASIIEKECGVKSQMKNVSSVIHNRLGIAMKLQCDVTINYVEKWIKPYIDGDENRYNEYYNTYKCSALPAGAICNPGTAAINAALYPADTEYLYFVTDANGSFLFASSLEEHQANCQTAGIS